MSPGGIRGFAAKVGRNLAFKTLTEIAGRLLSFLFYMAMARWLGVEQFGLFSLVSSVGAIAVFLVDPGLNITLVRNAPRTQGHLESSAAKIVALKLALSALTVAVCVAYGVLAGHGWYLVTLLALMGAQMAGFAMMEFAGAVFQAREEMWAETFLLSVGRTAVVVFAIAALWLGAGVGVTLVVMALTQAVAVAWALSWTVKQGTPLGGGWDIVSWGSILRDSIPLGAVTFFTILFYRVDVAMAPFLGIGLHDLGFYSAGVKILDVWLAAPSLLYSALFPTLSALAGGDRAGFVKWADRSLLFVTVGGMVGAVAGIYYSHQIVTIIFTESFSPSVKSLNILLMASIAMFIRHGLMMTLILDGRSRSVVTLAAVAVVINVIANLTATPHYGVMGMAGAKVATDLFMAGAGGYLWFAGRGGAHGG